mmetsp:Transcript_13122/g.38603  ORF Transcript_13122/g.38603 Transcript_13122/m.38603 type:complete len:524 (-) Transcript_13122:135-1706(-)
MRWLKMIPAPLIIELSDELRRAALCLVNSISFKNLSLDKEELLNRMGCRLIVLPSGAALSSPLETPSGGVTYGKLLFGGVTRFRLLPRGSGHRRVYQRAGERKEIMESSGDNSQSWLQFGGPLRMYEAVDMGPACVLEVTILPVQSSMTPLFNENESSQIFEDMAGFHFPTILNSLLCHETDLPGRDKAKLDADQNTVQKKVPVTSFDDQFSAHLKRRVGGLQPEIEAIIRRVLDGRAISPEPRGGKDKSALEAKELSALGLSPVRGLLLYGPSGTGKTMLAREISGAICALEPKILSAPELLDRWVGGSEKLVRSLFEDAEAELSACNGDPVKSALHVIVIDEIDAVFRKRSASSEGDAGEATRASAVNQILSKLDGVDAIPNVLLIGMTNRRELIDDALLRPGRLEVQIKIGLPGENARREILQIHFNGLRQRGRLSHPLCQSIDGRKSWEKRSWANPFRRRETLADLARMTDGFSGADIAGLVRCAGSIALSRSRQQGHGVDGLLITMEDVASALKEVKQ